MRRVTTATLAILIIQAVAGCGQDPAQETQAFQVRDSAGVAIGDNSAGEWTEATAWRLSSAPILTIGEFDGRKSICSIGRAEHDGSATAIS